MKKAALCLLAAAMIFGLCGCYDYTDIESKAMVAGLALDLTDRGYKVSAEILSSPSVGEEAKIETKIAYSEGKTISECIRSVVSESSKKLDFSHCKIVFISRKVAEQGIEPIIDLIFHHSEIKVSIDLAVIDEGEACEIFQTEPLLSSIVSYEAQETLETMDEYLSTSPRGVAYKVLNRIVSIGTEAILPLFSIRKDDQKESFLLIGCCIFQDDKMTGTLSGEEGMWLEMIRGDFKQGVATFTAYNSENNAEKKSFSPEIITFSGGGTPSKDDPYQIEIKAKLRLRMDDIPEGISLETKEKKEELEATVRQEIEATLLKFAEKIITQEKSDIFGFGRKIYNQNPEMKKEIEAKGYLEKLSFTTDIQIEIENSGISQKSIRE